MIDTDKIRGIARIEHAVTADGDPAARMAAKHGKAAERAAFAEAHSPPACRPPGPDSVPLSDSSAAETFHHVRESVTIYPSHVRAQTMVQSQRSKRIRIVAASLKREYLPDLSR